MGEDVSDPSDRTILRYLAREGLQFGKRNATEALGLREADTL